MGKSFLVVLHLSFHPRLSEEKFLYTFSPCLCAISSIVLHSPLPFISMWGRCFVVTIPNNIAHLV